MRGVLGCAVAVIMGLAQGALAQCDDPYDGTLCAELLTAQQAGQFSASDGQVSAFWSQLSGDRIELVAPDNCATGACGFVGTDDASMLIRAGATTQGLYLYVEVQDNTFVDRASADACCDDSADLYFDELSANDIFTCGGSCLIGLYNSTLSYTTNQVQVSMGATAPPPDFRFAYYDGTLWSWQTLNLTPAQAMELYGLQVEVVATDATHKVQEWFFPWEYLGDGIAVGTDISATRIGFAGGYNDKDGDNPDPDKLRWPGAGDPWAGDAQTVNYWGDILLPSGITVEPLSVRGPVRSVRDARVPAGASAARFTLTGQRVAGERNGATGVMVEKVSRTGQAGNVRLQCRFE